MDSTESIAPEFPPEPPQIPRGELWKCLLLPTVLTLLANLITAASGFDGYGYTLWFLPLVVGPIAGLSLTPWFVRILKTAYQGRSMVLMSIGYAFGQVILTPAIGFGGCLLTASNFGS